MTVLQLDSETQRQLRAWKRGRKKRNSNGYGTLVKRGNAFWGAYYNKLTKKREWVRLGVVSEQEARLLLMQTIKESALSPLKKDKITFSDLTKKFLESVNTNDKKRATIMSYEQTIRIHLNPFFGKMLVNSITFQDTDRFKISMCKKVNPVTKQTFSARTINYNLWLLSYIFEYAMNNDFRADNPMRKIKKLKQVKKERLCLPRESLEKFLNAVSGQDRLMILTTIATGVRLSELLAMKWSNVSFEEQTYTIKESLTRISAGRHIFGLPKTYKSSSKIYLPLQLLELIKEHKIEQEKSISQNQQKGRKYQDNNLVFPSACGTPINPTNFSKRVYYPARNKANLPKAFRFHDLRGTFLTYLFAIGTDPNTARDMIRHTSAVFSLEVYGRRDEYSKRMAAERLGSYIFNKTGGLTTIST